MKFKLDENFGPRIQEVFVRRGHDCRSVLEEALGGATHEKVSISGLVKAVPTLTQPLPQPYGACAMRFATKEPS
jgi:hypothetical protein